MIIKSFIADSAIAALKEVRREMGGDAIVLRTRQVLNGSGRARIEMTACIDRPTAARASAIMSSTPRSETARSSARPVAPTVSPSPTGPATKGGQPNDAGSRFFASWFQTEPDKLPFGALKEVYASLQEGDLPQTFLNHLMAAVIQEFGESDDMRTFAMRKLAEHLQRLVQPDISFEPGDKLLFLGPAGAGKSSVMGKLAAKLIGRDKQKVNLASLDHHKVAAHDELSTYAEILRAGVTDPLAAPGPGGDNSDSITLIDTAALPTDQQALARLQEHIQRISPRYRLAVFSALTRSDDVEELAMRMLSLSPTQVVVTMLDQTPRLGTAVAAAQTLEAKIAFMTNSPGGMGQVQLPDPEAMARQLLKLEVSHE